ncbi:2-hydroxychromene-2-carboxylate isomerase [Ferrovibrio sp.]|uniref:2-hydroxychromene-2-carboxylate isomerase n=1 Tax=Ferrovibrio sp. TaxID=1917215 RepID=UPI0026373641|nr:2-hydroxychromene-2-carboxylate isomerase [Ferrovibrio sp.]
MAKRIDYYVFLASPWAYLGSQRLTEIAKRHGAEMRIIPMAAAEVFPVSGGLPLAKRAPQRQAYRIVELKRWRDFLGMPLNLQPQFFPMNENLAARLVIAARDAGLDAVGLAHAMMRAVWAEDRNIAEPEVLEEILTECGMDPAKLFAAAETDGIKAEYARGTQQAVEANVFGAPSYVIDGEIFWGQDRLDFVERRLARG